MSYGDLQMNNILGENVWKFEAFLLVSRAINFFLEKTSEEIDACVETGLKEDCHHLPSHRPPRS